MTRAQEELEYAMSILEDVDYKQLDPFNNFNLYRLKLSLLRLQTHVRTKDQVCKDLESSVSLYSQQQKFGI